MLSEIRKKNSLGLIEKYCENLFDYISKKDFLIFIKNAVEFVKENNGKELNGNFISSFIELMLEHKLNNSEIIRNEFGYFNYLLGEFKKYGDFKDFKNLVKASIYNFDKNSFHHSLGEIAVCLTLSEKYNFKKYERKLQENKSIDFEFEIEKNNSIYVEVKTIDYNKNKYEKKGFPNFVNNRLKQYFDDKTKKLDSNIKRKIYIYPIFYGITVEIVKENKEYLERIYNSSIENEGFQSFSPRVFANIQGTFFRLFSIKEIVNPEKYFE